MRDCPDLICAAIKEENEIDMEEADVSLANTTIHTIASMSDSTWLGKYDFILDSGSQVSVARYEFLTELYRSPSGFQGLNGQPTRTTHKGILPGLGECIASNEARLNVLSLVIVEDVAEVEYLPGLGFVIHLGDRDIVFKRKLNLFIADMSDWSNKRISLATISEKEHMYTRKERDQAKAAGEFIKNSGYSTEKDAIAMM